MGILPGISITKCQKDTEHFVKNIYSRNMDFKRRGMESPGPAQYDIKLDSAWTVP